MTIGRRMLVSAARSASDTKQKLFGRGDVGNHQGERLVAALLAFAQQADGRVVERIADQMKSAEPFDRPGCGPRGEDSLRRLDGQT